MPLDLIVLNERQCYCLIILKCHFKDIAATRNDDFQCGIDGFKGISKIRSKIILNQMLGNVKNGISPLFAYNEIHENIFGYSRI